MRRAYIQRVDDGVGGGDAGCTKDRFLVCRSEQAEAVRAHCYSRRIKIDFTYWRNLFRF